MSHLLLILVAALHVEIVLSDFNCDSRVDDCPPNPAVNGIWVEDFSKSSSNWTGVSRVRSDWNNMLEVKDAWNETGLYLQLSRANEDLTYYSSLYIMFGHVKVTMNHQADTGVQYMFGLRSDNRADSISHYFWKGNVSTNYGGYYTAGSANNSNIDPTDMEVFDDPNTYGDYEIEWTHKRIIWSINGRKVREITPTTVKFNVGYPQTPMYVEFFMIADDADGAPPSYAMNIRSMELTDYSTGYSYKTTDKTGMLSSIESNGGFINGSDRRAANNTSTAAAVSSPTWGLSGAANATNTNPSEDLGSAETGAATPTSSPNPTNSATTSALGIAAQAGIGVGVGIAGLAILTGAIISWKRRRTHRPMSKEKFRDGQGVLAVDDEPGVLVNQ